MPYAAEIFVEMFAMKFTRAARRARSGTVLAEGEEESAQAGAERGEEAAQEGEEIGPRGLELVRLAFGFRAVRVASKAPQHGF